nr:PREDICTED: uncharacterized protein LOC105663670 [Megachile rotundata]
MSFVRIINTHEDRVLQRVVPQKFRSFTLQTERRKPEQRDASISFFNIDLDRRNQVVPFSKGKARDEIGTLPVVWTVGEIWRHQTFGNSENLKQRKFENFIKLESDGLFLHKMAPLIPS